MKIKCENITYYEDSHSRIKILITISIQKNWMESEDFKRTYDYYCGNIELVYNGEILEQYHIEIDKFTVEDFRE